MLAEQFSSIGGLRELSDGRVLVADTRENRLVLIGPQGARDVGRTGAGPGEFARAGYLFAGNGDTTYMQDFANQRLAIVGPDGTIGDKFLPMRNDGWFAVATAHDRSGYFYGGGALVPMGERSGTPILRWRAGERPDTLTVMPTLRRLGGPILSSGGRVMATEKQAAFERTPRWFASSGGNVSIVQSTPYRVDRVGPDGALRMGPIIPYDSVQVGAAERAEWLRMQAGAQGPTVVIDPAARQRAQAQGRTREMAPGNAPRALAGEEAWDFPRFKPAWVDAQMAPDGSIWIERSRPANSPRQYDVVDEAGRVVQRVELPADRELAGFGARSLYLSRTDQDGLITIERYARPGS